MRGIDAVGAAINLMKLHGPVNTLPQIEVLDRDHLSEALPPPAVLAPFDNPMAYPFSDVTA
jgi:hypothetical protein